MYTKIREIEFFKVREFLQDNSFLPEKDAELTIKKAHVRKASNDGGF